MSKKRFRAIYIGAGKFYPSVPSRDLNPDEVAAKISDGLRKVLEREKVFKFVEIKEKSGDKGEEK